MFVGHVGIRVTDLETSVKFYGDVPGLRVLRSGDFMKARGGK